MFYITFAFTVLIFCFIIWAVVNIYVVFELSHKASVIYGRLVVLLNKRQELIHQFVNKLSVTDDTQKEAALEIKESQRLLNSENDVAKKLVYDHEMEDKLAKFEHLFGEKNKSLIQELKEARKSIVEELERYNRVALKLEKLYGKKMVVTLMNILHIKRVSHL